MASPSLMDSLFQRSLDDLIKGLRLHQSTASTAAFITRSLEEIRREIKSTDPATKSTALAKLTYLHSLHGVDMSWAAFHCVELASSAVHSTKRLAYLSATLSFDPSTTDVILLLTHQLRKDLNSTNPHDVSLALHSLSSISNPDLARDLTPELFTLLNSSKQFIKNKAIAALLRVFSQYPDAVRVCFKRLVENLENSDVGIVSAVVGVFCELCHKDSRSYLPLAPEFYKILVDCRNNWVLIKILKIFAKLVPLEPRLGKRVVEPICEHMRRTGAKSLLFECVKTILSTLSEFDSAVTLAVGKIKEFLIDEDPNLKYLGLQALSIVAEKHSWPVLENKEFVIKSLSDMDVNIKLEALRLVMVMVSEDNVAEICKVLTSYALKSDPEFCNEILGSILGTCSRNYYEIIVDFDWYVMLLGEMARIPHCQKGEEIEGQLVDIGMRVKDVRPELVRVGRDLLIDPALLGNHIIHSILSAAAWVSGEYVEYSRNPFELMEALLQPRTSLLPPLIRAVYIQSVFKVMTFCLNSYLFKNGVFSSTVSAVTSLVDDRECSGSSNLIAPEPNGGTEADEVFNPRIVHPSVGDISMDNSSRVIMDRLQTFAAAQDVHQFTKESLSKLLNLVEANLGPLVLSHEVELQERARNVISLVKCVRQDFPSGWLRNEGDNDNGERKASEIVKLMQDAFSEELGPVSLSAQERVPIPDGLVLKENLADLETVFGDLELTVSGSFSLGRPWCVGNDMIRIPDHQDKEESGLSTESTSLLAEHRKRHGLYYLPSAEKEITSSDYPPANDPTSRVTVNDDTEDLVKLTEQSLISKKKATHMKPRPVVVKLDEGDRFHIAARKPEVKDDLISGVVRDVLLGKEAISSSSRSNPIVGPSSKRKGKDTSNMDKPLELIGDSGNVVRPELANTSSRRSKHRTHGKGKKHRSPMNEREGYENNDKQKTGHRHGRHTSRQRADGVKDVVAQSPVIPDFLL